NATGCGEHRHRHSTQLFRHRLQRLELITAPAVFDLDVLPLDEVGISQATAESSGEMRGVVRATADEISDHWHSTCLRARYERPRHRPSEQRDEVAARDHSITSSARASSAGGTSRPRAFAVLRLIRSSNLVGSSTGKSPAFTPFNILATYAAARW